MLFKDCYKIGIPNLSKSALYIIFYTEQCITEYNGKTLYAYTPITGSRNLPVVFAKSD